MQWMRRAWEAAQITSFNVSIRLELNPLCWRSPLFAAEQNGPSSWFLLASLGPISIYIERGISL